MSTSLWKDPLQERPADNDVVWIRVLLTSRAPLLATYHALTKSFEMSIDGQSIYSTAVYVVAWRPQ